MDRAKPVVGIISKSQETREQILAQLQAAKFDCFTVEVDCYLTDIDEYQTRQLIEVRPRIIIVDMETRETALSTLRFLHDALPETWLFVSAVEDDPQLIIETMHAGALEFLPRSSSLERLSQALERYSEKQKKTTTRKKGKVFCVTSAKGGAGTTSVAINLAVATAKNPGNKVALADFSGPVGDVAEYMNLKTKYTIADVLTSATRLDPVLLESYMSSAHGVAVLPGTREFNSGLFQHDNLTKMIQVLSGTFTHTFIDIACSHNQEQLQIVTHLCDTILIILTPELPALWRTSRLIQLFDKNDASARNKLHLVVNRASKNREIGVREIEKTLGHPIFWSLPNNYPQAIEAVNSGKPLVSSGSSRLATSYLELGQILTGMSLVKMKWGFSIPALTSRRAEQEVEPGDSQSAAIAGVMDNSIRDNISKVPGLGDIPILGNLFKSKTSDKNKKELTAGDTSIVVPPLESDQEPAPPEFPEPFMDNKGFDKRKPGNDKPAGIR